MSWSPPTAAEPERPTVPQVLRRYWLVIAVIVAAIGLVGVSQLSDPTDDVHPAIVDMVDTLKAQRDCSSLQAAFDRTDDADELRYIDDALDDAGCYD